MVLEVEDSVAVGLRADGDVKVILFVKLAPTAGVAGRGAGEVRETEWMLHQSSLTRSNDNTRPFNNPTTQCTYN